MDLTPRKNTFRLFASLAVVCALLYLGDFMVHSGIRHLRRGRFGSFNQAADGKVNADIVISGSSRAALHYDPAAIEAETGLSTFNIGHIGAPTIVHAAILRQYLSHNSKPKLIIQNADPGSLISDPEVYEPVQYVPYLDDPGLYGVLGPRYRIIQLGRYLPVYGYVVNDVEGLHYQGLKAILGKEPYEEHRNGFLVRHNGWNQNFAQLRASRRFFVYPPDPVGIQDMRFLLEQASSRQIPVIVVFSPIYREHLQMTRDLAAVRAKLADVSREGGAEFWDYSDFSPVSDSTDYFVDSTHMSLKGATTFSTALGRRLKTYLQQLP
jgi:hypothetical protein